MAKEREFFLFWQQLTEVMKYFFFLFVTIALMFSAVDLKAQISASETEGCAPLASVVFTSSFSNPTNILWDFNDGATSNLPSPTHSFANPGVYNVSYTAISGGAPVNASITITVYGNPEAAFTIIPEDGVCLGQPIQFTDASTGGSGSAITSVQWDFGDGSGANGASVSHTYANPGTYTVTLIATDGNGCVASLSQNNAVAVSQPPTINITTNPDPVIACEAPLNVSFTNTTSSNSPTGSGLTHSWDFGNGQTSDLQTPATITYTTEGAYTIVYTATDNVGCSATKTIPVSVQQPTAEIIVLDLTNGVSCGDVEFEIEGTQGGMFDYGDGSTGYSLFHNYTSEGSFTVTYSISVAGCSAEASTTLAIEIPTAEIISSPGYACYKPADFTYSLSSNYNIDEFLWTFIDGETSIAANPTHPLDYPGPGEYDINSLQLFATSLTFTTINGCPGSAVIIDSLALPNALFYPNKTQGCAPLQTIFTDKSSYFIPGYIEEWEWHFGDGTILNATQSSNPSHSYTEPGKYEAYLIITTTEGCIDTSFTHTIEVGEPISPSFTLEPATICQGEPVQVVNTSVNMELIQAYSYSGDGFTLDNCPDEDEPELIFDDVTGIQTVTQFAEYNGCIDSYTQSITVLGPIGKLNYECNCDTPLDYVFKNTASHADFWTWDFGDGTIIENSTDALINHSYNHTGDYEVTLTSYSNTSGCEPYIDSTIVNVRQVEARIDIQELACVGAPVDLSAISSSGVGESACSRNYLWYFGDGSRPIKTLLPTTEHVYPAGGDFTTQLFVEDINGCVDSTSALIQVFDITAAYESDTLSGCPPIEVNFSDLTQADTTIVSWTWNFDDGNTSLNQNPTNIFEDIDYDTNNNPIPFTVSLEVTDVLGCTSNINTLVITPLGPNPAFEAISESNICVGDMVNFEPTGSDINSHTYDWEYGNDSTSVGSEGSSIFTDAGSFDISLTVTDESGCARALTQSLVEVQAYPTAIIDPSYDDDEVLCYPVIASFTDISVSNIFDTRTWNLNMGGAPLDAQTVQTTFQAPGFYNIDLEVSTTFGCTSDTTLVVEVQGPVAEMELNPMAICPGGSIELNLVDTADLATWQFDFGDGNETTNQWPAYHDYDVSFIPSTGQTLITLIMYSEDSVCTAARTTPLIIEEVIAGFDRNNEAEITDSIHCFGIPDIFTNTSTPNATSYLWTYSNGQTYTSQQPPNQNLPPGEYTINLQVESALGCRDTVEKYMRIFPLPIAEVNGGEICRGDDILLTATGGVIYNWQPAGTINDPTSDVVFASPETTTQYTVFVTDTNNCTSPALSNVLVYQPAPSIERDTVLRIGDSDFTGFDLGAGYNYEWTPNIELECNTCPNTTFTPLENRTYTLTISDIFGCFSTDSYFYFEILEVASVDLPDAFTPNADGINDKVFVKGWGIESLISFSIYNRWGEQIFHTNNIEEGWDGTYKGKTQSPDSYAYIVVVKNYIHGEPTTIKGFIDLVK